MPPACPQYATLKVGTDEAACLERARQYSEWCGNQLHQQTIVTYAPTGASAAYPPDDVVEKALRALSDGAPLNPTAEPSTASEHPPGGEPGGTGQDGNTAEEDGGGAGVRPGSYGRSEVDREEDSVGAAQGSLRAMVLMVVNSVLQSLLRLLRSVFRK